MSLDKTEVELPDLKFEPIWLRKVRTLFRRLDHSGQGYISMEHVLEVASALISEFPKMPAHLEDALVKKTLDLWITVLSRHLPASQRVNGYITEHSFVDNLKASLNQAEFRQKFFGLLVEPSFQAVDSDQDGLITPAEFKAMMTAWKAPPNEAELIFRQLDSRKAGKLDVQQVRGALVEFFFTESAQSKANKLWGALIDYKRPEDYPVCQCSPVWEGKMRNMFRRLDVHGQGKLRCDEFIEIGKNLAQRGHLNKTKTHYLLKALLNVWIKFFGIDKEGVSHEEVGEQEFVHNLRDRINTDFRQEIDQLGWSFFKAVEVGGYGYITLQEYRNLQESWNVNRDEADGMFHSIDTDKDGKVQLDEYLNAWCDYFLSEDANSPYKMFFGPSIIRHVEMS